MAGNIPELGLASGVHGIREWGPSPGWASERDPSLQPAGGVGRWEVPGGGLAEGQGWGFSLEKAAAWLWLPALPRGRGGAWLCERAWVPSVSSVVDLGWGLESAVPPEPLQASEKGRPSPATASPLSWVWGPGCRDSGLGRCSEPSWLFIGVPERGCRAAGPGWTLEG